ncbi:MAG: DNA replication/repair protein RecF [Caulobacteraceae bacterium]
MLSRIDHLQLVDFRSYERADLATQGRSVFLFGPNGAGKTNLLEAVSLFSPGRGLRGSALAEMGRRGPNEDLGRAWAVSARLAAEEGEIRIGTGLEAPGAGRRTVRIEGENTPPSRLAEWVRPIWLTPAQDRLFLDGATERRRFLDRLVFAIEPEHGAHVSDYERALRERTRLLEGGEADDGWLTALEARMAAAGARVAEARTRAVAALGEEIDARGERPFPKAALALTGEWEAMAARGAGTAEIETGLAAALIRSRARDRAAGRGLCGPHRGDLAVRHRDLGRLAAECSTGEQKALILNLVLAQAARLSRANSQPNPILLLDEVAAHLDPARRCALFDEIEALCLQAFLTGTEETLFEALKGSALGVRIDASTLIAMEEA